MTVTTKKTPAKYVPSKYGNATMKATDLLRKGAGGKASLK